MSYVNKLKKRLEEMAGNSSAQLASYENIALTNNPSIHRLYGSDDVWKRKFKSSQIKDVAHDKKLDPKNWMSYLSNDVKKRKDIKEDTEEKILNTVDDNDNEEEKDEEECESCKKKVKK